MNTAAKLPTLALDRLVTAVRWAYRLVLAREPENQRVLANWASLQDPQAVLRHIARSPEAAQVAASRRPPLGSWVNEPTDADAVEATWLLLSGCLPTEVEIAAALKLCPDGAALRRAFLSSPEYAEANGAGAPAPAPPPQSLASTRPSPALVVASSFPTLTLTPPPSAKAVAPYVLPAVSIATTITKSKFEDPTQNTSTPLQDGTKIFFLHIPKTAGTAVHHALSTKFAQNEICPDRFRELDGRDKNYMEKYRFFSGHFTSKSINKGPDKKFTFTVLRDPVDRVVSLYYFWKRHSQDLIDKLNLQGPKAARQAKSLEDFLSIDGPPIINAVKNEIARVLAGGITIGSSDVYYEMKGKEKNAVDKTEIIRRASETVNRFDFILFTKTLDQEFKFLCLLLGANPIPELSKLNTRYEHRDGFEAAEQEEMRERTVQLLRHHTEMDSIIYKIALIRRAELIQNIEKIGHLRHPNVRRE